jgi:hypothetical protein
VAGCGARATVLRLDTYDLELARGWECCRRAAGGLLMEVIGDQDCARRASAYAKLAEEPSNLDFREQYLHLARAWMDLALEQAPP